VQEILVNSLTPLRLELPQDRQIKGQPQLLLGLKQEGMLKVVILLLLEIQQEKQIKVQEQ